MKYFLFQRVVVQPQAFRDTGVPKTGESILDKHIHDTGQTEMGNALSSGTKVAAETRIATSVMTNVFKLVKKISQRTQQQVCGACRYMLDF